MPTQDTKAAITMDEARHRAGLTAFPDRGDEEKIGGVGLEPEFFPIVRDGKGLPATRLTLSQPDGQGVLEIIDGLAEKDPRVSARTGTPPAVVEFPLDDGGRITFEPGAQVEHSTAVHPSVASAVDDVDDLTRRLRSAFDRHNVSLAAIGMDIWHDVETVPQQLRAGRYTAQAAYYRQRGHWGAVMMRHTASLQINLDLGPEDVWKERWLLANLASPFMTASFASSPGDDAVCTRARAWQELDPTRSGFPSLLVHGEDNDPRGEWAQAALDADVMLYRLEGERFEPGCVGCSFEKWIREGHPKWGWPTAEDLDYHLTTLFFEVRPRGFLELRAGEELPSRWRPVPVALMATLLYEDRTLFEALDLLGGLRQQLPGLWQRAALVGVRDSELRDLACGLWETGIRGMERLPTGYLGDDQVEASRLFLEHFTARGRVPGDDLVELNDEDPAHALRWASS